MVSMEAKIGINQEDFYKVVDTKAESMHNPIEPKQKNFQDGIEILVEMSKKGSIDPWNIDIVDVTDKFLNELTDMKMNNLRFTGRTLFFAAVLLRLKSDILEGIDPLAEEPEEFFDDFGHEEDNADLTGINTNNVISLEDALTRRTSVRLNRNRVVTLNDLIKQLEFYEKIEKRMSVKSAQDRAIRRVKSYADFTAEDIVEMAHEEYIEDSIDSLHNVLLKLFESSEKVELKELCSTGMDKATLYITLLFLAAKERIDLVQDEFYSDLYIVPEGA